MRTNPIAVALAGMLLAQLAPSGGPNLGIPSVPGTRTPENSPGTAIETPSAPAAPMTTGGPSSAASPAPTLGTNSGPAYSFGAAPSPTVAPGR